MASPDNVVAPVVAILALAIAIAPTATAQSHDLVFHQITVADSPSHGAVSSIVEDPDGFLWFGTGNGLLWYNGHRVKSYARTGPSPEDLPSSTVWDVFAAADGTIWVATDAGLACFDPRSERFHSYRPDPTDPHSLGGAQTLSLCEDREGTLWIGSENGVLSALDRGSGRFRRYSAAAGTPGLGKARVQVLLETRDGTLWVGQYDGLSRYDRAGDRFVPLAGMEGVAVRELFEDAAGHLWIGATRGLARYDPERHVIDWFRNDPDDPHSLPPDGVYGINEDPLGRIWVSVYGSGVSLLDVRNGVFRHYRPDPRDQRSVPSNYIDTIFRDRTGTMWLGTFDCGVVNHDPRDELAIKYRNLPGDPSSLMPGKIRALLEGEDGRIWVAGDKGMQILTPKTDHLQRIDPPLPADAGESWNALAVAPGPGHQIIAGCRRGWRRFAADGTPLDGFHRPSSTIALARDGGRLWILAGSGLWSVDGPGTAARLELPVARLRVPRSHELSSVCVDGEHQVWIGTSVGLRVFGPADGHLATFSLAAEDGGREPAVTTIQRTAHGLWVTTYSGLFLVDPMARTARRAGSTAPADAFAVMGVVDVPGGPTLLSTLGRLHELDDAHDTTHEISQRLGLPFHHYHQGCALVARDGRVYFGGTRGIDAIEPGPPQSAPSPVVVRITGLRVRKSLVTAGPRPDGRVLLPRPLPYVDHVVLSRDDLPFALEAAILDYANPAQDRFEVRLDGLDDDWWDLGRGHWIEYNSLAPGDYTLLVRGKSVGGHTGTAPPLRITVLTPFWMTWWFRAAVAAALVAIAFALHRLRTARMRDHGRELERMNVALEAGRDELQATNQRLQQEIARRRRVQEDLAITLDSIGDGVIATDSEGLIRRINRVAEELTGWPRERAIGRRLTDVFRIVDSRTEQPVASPVDRVLADGATVTLANHTMLLGRDGSRRQIADSGAPIRRGDGDIRGVVLVFRDITVQHELEAQLQHSQKMESLGQLAGGIAHDFNNLIGGVRGYAELTALELADVAESAVRGRITTQLDAILGLAERAAGLTRQLLTFSRKGPVESKWIDVGDLIDEVWSILERTIDKRVRLVRSPGPVGLRVRGDRSQLLNTLLNLGINARDAMPEGGKLTLAMSKVHLDEVFCSQPSVEVEAGTYAAIQVSDTGTGMDPTTLARIFDPFFSTKSGGQGTGLGLATAYGTVKAHGGAILVQSLPGTGTVFKVLLPIADGVADGEAPPRPRATVTGSGCILVVDDERSIREILTKGLQKVGYHVLTAEDGEQGLAVFHARRHEISLVILDCVMPRRSGRGVLRAIRDLDRDLPVLMASGFLQDADADKLLAEGANAVVAKPFGFADLTHRIADLLERARIRH